uniref:Phosphopantothenate--cysteine ligase n=1 Tax=Crassostrea virginica TaxID=6565 RepID=A0A8B8EJA8_CRAVI|nr:phosphopantothenate--cysteine ligase-like [Crassostrea virginica]
MAAKFLSENSTPERLGEKRSEVLDFVERHKRVGRRVVLVTSGGTTVPLESKTVRFIDNFSVGSRGAASTEYFLKEGYAVIFLHRNRSLKPFLRHLSSSNFLDLLQLDAESLTLPVKVRPEHQEHLSSILRDYERVRGEGTLLGVEFQSLSEYLHLLQVCATCLQTLGRSAMLYLAAAVADFYIPPDQMPEHKIQSSEGPLNLSLQLVPKMLEPLVKEWVPKAFVVSFKLETNKDILVSKSLQALDKYQHQLVVANLLETRKKEVKLVTKESCVDITMTTSELSNGQEIEQKIVKELSALHSDFCSVDKQS